MPPSPRFLADRSIWVGESSRSAKFERFGLPLGAATAAAGGGHGGSDLDRLGHLRLAMARSLPAGRRCGVARSRCALWATGSRVLPACPLVEAPGHPAEAARVEPVTGGRAATASSSRWAACPAGAGCPAGDCPEAGCRAAGCPAAAVRRRLRARGEASAVHPGGRCRRPGWTPSPCGGCGGGLASTRPPPKTVRESSARARQAARSSARCASAWRPLSPERRVEGIAAFSTGFEQMFRGKSLILRARSARAAQSVPAYSGSV